MIRTALLVSAIAALACSPAAQSLARVQPVPGIDWSSYLGGSISENIGWPNGVTATRNGDVILGGATNSKDFPTSPQSRPFAGASDVFVTRITADGTRCVWSLLIGGSGSEGAKSIHLDETKNLLYVTGYAGSKNFPTTPGAIQSTLSGTQDAFLVVMNPTTGVLVYSTLLGGSGSEGGNDLAVEPNGEVVIVGRTDSTNFPATTNALLQKHAGGKDGMIAHIRPGNGGIRDLLYASYLGGTQNDSAICIKRIGVGISAVAGWTQSLNFPVSNAYQPGPGGGQDGYACILDRTRASSSQLRWSSYLGGNGTETLSGLDIDPAGVLTVGGATGSTNLPATPRAFQRSLTSVLDAYVMSFDWSLPPAQQLRYCTYLGGPGNDVLNGLYVDASGVITMAGVARKGFPTTRGSAFPTAITSNPAQGDAFVARLDPRQNGAAQLIYSSFFGGSDSYTQGFAMGSDGLGGTYVSGRTRASRMYVTPGVCQASLSGIQDVFVVRFSMLPDGVTRHGTTSANCGRPIFTGVDSMPFRGNTGWAASCTGAPASTLGFLLMSAPSLRTPWDLLGVTLHVGQPCFVLAVASDSRGAHRLPVSLASMPVGTQVDMQYTWLNPNSCGTTSLLSASNLLAIGVRP